jgi:hypothetical protein
MAAKALLPLLLATLATMATATTRLRSLAADDGFCSAQQYIENGFDYEGNDIGNVPSVPSSACCQACRNLAGCKAWSWSVASNGTCWLKSDRGRTIANRYVQSSLVPPTGSPLERCGPYNDVDFPGNDIGGFGSPSADQCVTLCRSYPGCRAFAWTNQNGGTCYLKSSRGQAIVKKGVVASEAFHSFSCGPVCALDADVDYVGNDIGSAPSAAPGGCCALCSKTPHCRAFAWSSQSGGTCYLKNYAAPGVAKSGVTSAVVVPNPVCDVTPGTDIVGNDIANVPSTDAGACCSICSDRADCKAYTWSNHQGGTCWLKNAKTPTVANAQTTSGAVRT